VSGEKQDRGARLRDVSISELPPEVVGEEGNPVVISEAPQVLPQMNCSGLVRSLRAAMSLTGTEANESNVPCQEFSLLLGVGLCHSSAELEAFA
jgi:hypothetical protein